MVEPRRALGTFNFYRSHIPEASHDMAALTQILQGHSRKNDRSLIEWTEVTKLAFTSPKCGTLTWWGGLSGLIKY